MFFLVEQENIQTHNENNIINLKYFINKFSRGKTTKYIHIFNDISLHFSMYSNIILSQEEKFLINILFKENELNNKSFRLLDYEKLVKNVSSHLMIPALYINLEKKKYLKKIPDELKKYIEEIYTINRIRNETLLKEIHEISKILKSKSIDHVFLKGSAHVICKIYNDIGERMIGDIDILVNNNSAQSIKALQDFNYRDSEYNFFEDRHKPRQINRDKKFAVEIHKRLLRKNLNIFNTNDLLKSKIYTNGIPTLNYINQLKHNIYNYQINDYGNLKLSYSYRSLYDSFKLINSTKATIKDISKNNYTENYFMICKELNITNLNDEKTNNNIVNLFLFRKIKSNKLFANLYRFICRVYRINVVLNQIREIIFNKKYRNYLLKKYSEK